VTNALAHSDNSLPVRVKRNNFISFSFHSLK